MYIGHGPGVSLKATKVQFSRCRGMKESLISLYLTSGSPAFLLGRPTDEEASSAMRSDVESRDLPIRRCTELRDMTFAVKQ